MRSLALVTATLVVLGSVPGFAQNAPMMGAHTPSSMSAMSPNPMSPTTIPMPSTSPLGAIPSTLGTAATLAAPAIGTIATCLGGGPGGAMSSTLFDASSAVGLTGALPTQIPPGATAPPNSSFAPSISNGTCNPAINAQNATEILGNTTVAPIPGLATITGPQYDDATVPATSTETGGDGLSPQIIVPTPDSAAAPMQ